MRIKSALTTLGLFLFVAASASAANLIWDPNQTSGVTPGGNGNWDTTDTFFYNGTADVAWTQTSITAPTMGAIFNGTDAAPGTYNVTNSATQLAVTSLTVNNNGYAFWGPNPIYVGTSDTLAVAANKTVTFNCNMSGSGTSPFWTLGAGATMNVTGNLTSGQQVRLAGAAGSAFNFTGTANAPSIAFVLGQVNVTAGSFSPSQLMIGNINPATINGVAYTTGTVNVSGSSTVVTINGNILIIGRTGGTGTLNVSNGTVTVGNTTAARNLAINFDSSAGSSGTVNVSGGTLTVGSGTQTGNVIDFFDTGVGAGTGASAILNQTGGTINAVNGIVFGPPSGSLTGGFAALTNSGGFLYVGSKGIALNTVAPPSYVISLSGGTVGALANWSSSLPMTLGTPNNTFQCADNNGSTFNISLSGPLTGNGGIYVTGTGTLSLSGANTFSGASAVSNGTLSIVTGPVPSTNGSVTVDGTAGAATLAAQVSNPGQTWSIGGLTFVNGSPVSTFGFGVLAPSTSVAPIQVSGSVFFTATPSVNITGTSIAVGTYPLIKYTGALSGALPTSLSVPGYISSAFITNISATKTIALVVTASTYNPALSWAVGSGIWDINTTANWKQFGGSAKYQDGDAVLFDDSATGPSPISVTLNTIVNPLSVTANNSSNQYTIGGSGSIAGSTSVVLLNNGPVTLAGTNTYTGGTVVGSGSQLNINNGGTSTASAIGTGTLTLNAGAIIDNTSGSSVTLVPSVPETWNGNFTYAGSSTNFNTGPGSITMNADVAVSVSSNTLTVAGGISDNGTGFVLSKTGNGTLTLPMANSPAGGFTLSAGLLNIGDPGALGSAVFKITGGTFDNVTGAPLVMNPVSSYVWAGDFTFLGSQDLNMNTAPVSIPNGLGNITVNIVSNTLTSIGDIQNNNTEVTKTGNGTWAITGGSSGTQSLGLVVSGGQVLLDKTGGQAITGGNNVGLTVQTGAMVQDGADNQIRSDGPVPLPVNLFGGTWDMNGFKENVDLLSLTTGGTLRNSASGGTSTINLISGHTASLTGPDCQFEVDASDGILNFQGPIGGTGDLVKTGAGLLNLSSNNVYTGATIISDGTIALLNSASISNTTDIDLVATNSTLDLSGETNSQTLSLESGQTIEGFGMLNGSLAAGPGSTVESGSATNVGALAITGSATLGGTMEAEISEGSHTGSELVVTGSLAYGGALTVGNLSGSAAIGNSFTLFSAAGYSGSFSSITLPSIAPGLAWDRSQLQLATGGSIVVATATQPRIQSVKLSGTTLSLTGGNGLPYEPYVVLESSNVGAPLSSWTQVASGTFDSSGNFNVSFSTGSPQQFYVLQLKP